MSTLRAASLLLLLIVVLPSEGRTAAVRRLSLAQVMRAGGFTIPTEWAGVWAYDDTTRECGSMEILDIDTGVDTLCAGVSLEPDTTGGGLYTCSGTISATEIDLTCSYSFSFESCTVAYEQTTRATRSGETVRSYFRISTLSTPPLCAFFPDFCEEAFEKLTRIAPAPLVCMTPVQEATWSRVKTWYR